MPALTSVQRRLCEGLFRSGSRYLGDEEDMLIVKSKPIPESGSSSQRVSSGRMTSRSFQHALVAHHPGAPEARSKKSSSVPPSWVKEGATSVPWVELAVMGRSNAGKSTLLNTLLGASSEDGKKAYVPVSKRPGTTARLDFYSVGTKDPPSLVLVDTPGYGFSSKGKGAHAAWMSSISQYLKTRRTMSSGVDSSGSPLLARGLVVVDSRQGLTDIDMNVINSLEAARLPFHLILSKADLVSDAQLTLTVIGATTKLSKLAMPFPYLNVVSCTSGEGMDSLQEVLMHLSKLHRLEVEGFREHVAEVTRMREAEEAATV